MRARRHLSAALALVLGCHYGCEEPVHPCDEFARFATALELRCGVIAWDCKTIYPTLGPAAQQDLDWCLDCVRAQEEGQIDRVCESAPLSGEACAPLLARTLDATCLSEP